MKKQIIAAIVLCALTITANAQEIKNLFPKENKVYLTDKGAADYEKAIAFAKKKGWDKLTDADWENMVKLGFSETRSSYWDIVGEGCSWYCGDGGPIKITASSRLKSQGKNDYNEKNLHDLMYNTPWVEGVKGYGIGQWVEYTFKANNPRITEIHVVNGYVKSQAAWKNNSRVKRLKVYVNGQPLAILNLEDSRSDQTFEIEPLTFKQQWTMRFEILEVYEGDKFDDTALSEIYFSGLDVHCLAPGTKIAMADGTFKNIEDIELSDQVLSFDKAGKSIAATVEETANAKHCNLVTYTFDNGTTLTATTDHPLHTTNGWASYAPEKSANYKGFENINKIQVGDSFETPDGTTLKLVAISPSHKVSETYTIVRLSQGNAFVANGIITAVEELNPELATMH